MNNKKLNSERTIAILITAVIIFLIIVLSFHNIYEIYNLLVAYSPWLKWPLGILGATIVFALQKAIEIVLQRYYERQYQNARRLQKILDNSERLPKKIEEIEEIISKIKSEIKTIKRVQETNEDSILRFQGHLSAISPETLLSTIIYVEDRLGMLRSNFYHGEYDGTKGCIVILNNDQYNEFLLKEQNSSNLLNLQKSAFFDEDATSPLQ